MAAKRSPQKEATFSIGYFPGLDVLRFICATMVIFHHVAQILFERGLIAAPVLAHKFSGSFFLDVFFIISGFLIGSILIKETGAGKFSLKNFYLRRIIRIWPLYFLIVLLLVVLVPYLKGISPGIIKTNALYATGFAVNFQLMFDEAAKTYSILWSVCVEEHIYLVLPFLVLLFGKKFKLASVFMIFTGFLSWFYFSAVHNAGGPTAYFNSLCYLLFFGAGMLMACFHKIILSDGLSFLFGMPAQAFMYSLSFAYVFNFFPQKWYGAVFWIPMSTLLGTYLVAAASRENFLFTVRNSWARFGGNISYAMYLVHVLMINVFINMLLKKNVHPGSAAVLYGIPLAVTVITMLVSAALYYLYERPILKLKGKYTVIENK